MEPSAIFPSPDGRHELRLLPSQQRHSHEVHSPALYELENGACIFWCGPLWEAWNVKWHDGGERLTFNLRRYDEPSTDFELEILIPEKRARLSTTGIRVVTIGSFTGVAGEMGNVGSVRELFM